MAKYFYTGGDGIKRGPYNEQHLQELVTRGLIGKNTPLETDTGHVGLVGQVPGLKFDSGSQQASLGFFDIGFTRFITNTWTSILWGATIGATFLGCVIALVVALFSGEPILFFVALLIVPISAALFLLFMRMSFELTIVIFRIETHLRSIREHYEKK